MEPRSWRCPHNQECSPMKFFSALAAAGLMLCSAAAAAACPTGLYRSPDGKVEAAIYHTSSGSARYTLTNGERGAVGGPAALLSCVGNELLNRKSCVE